MIQSAADLVPGNETEAVELARLQQEAVDFELQEYVRALNGGLAGVNAPMAAAAIENFKLTHNPQDLAAVKQFFPPQVVAAVSADSAVFNTQKAQSYDMSRRGRTLSGITKALFEFENSAGKGWFKEPGAAMWWQKPSVWPKTISACPKSRSCLMPLKPAQSQSLRRR